MEVLTVDDNVVPALNPRRWHALPVVLTGSFLSFLDFFIVNIALPVIRRDLTASPAQLQLIVAAYGIGFGVSLITGGRVGDMFGRKRVFLIGVGAFTIASALCGLALTPEMLIASRALQGVTAALMTPQVLAIIRVEFTREEQPFAIGLYGASMGFASIVAQLVGGLLVGLNIFGWSWRSVFLMNIPIGLVAIVVGMRTIKESRSLRRSPLDFLGIGLASLVLFFLIYPIVQGRESGWPLWSFVMVALVPPLMTAFIAHERNFLRSGGLPLIALHLFGNGTISLGLMVSFLFYSGGAVFFVILTVFFQEGFGLSPAATGLMFLPFALGFAAASSSSAAVARRIGMWVINLGTVLMMVGLLGIIEFARTAAASAENALLQHGIITTLFLVYGVGQGFAQPALINLVVGSKGTTSEDAGSAAGIFLTVIHSSMALGVASIGDVFFWALAGSSTKASYLDALSKAFMCNLLLLVATFMIVLWFPKLARGLTRATVPS
jgi:MFS family permease